MNASSDETAPSGYAVFDAIAIIVLSLTTVGSAWCSYQSAVWSGISAKATDQSITLHNESLALQIKANQSLLLDVFVLSQHLEALSLSNAHLAKLYADRFRPELKQAYEAWMRTRPFENPKAPSTPFATNFYNQPMLADADRLKMESSQLWDKAVATQEVAHRYILITVMLATALFLAGAAPRFRTRKGRRGALVLGLIVMVVAATLLLFLRFSAAHF